MEQKIYCDCCGRWVATLKIEDGKAKLEIPCRGSGEHKDKHSATIGRSALGGLF